jgi:hypothetical protein
VAISFLGKNVPPPAAKDYKQEGANPERSPRRGGKSWQAFTIRTDRASIGPLPARLPARSASRVSEIKDAWAPLGEYIWHGYIESIGDRYRHDVSDFRWRQGKA